MTKFSSSCPFFLPTAGRLLSSASCLILLKTLSAESIKPPQQTDKPNHQQKPIIRQA